MSEGFKGQCLCGAVHYESSADPAMMVKCHCRDCQYISGGEATVIVWLPKEALNVAGAIKTYSVAGKSGKKVHRRFCPECGTHLYSEADVVSEPLVFIKAGTMDKDASASLKTAMVFWAENANPFCRIDEDVKVFDQSPQF